jgi:primosomal protein N' (replication factor Y)
VTGSGKTEIYIRLIQNVLERGQSAIVLVPEISLTPQAVSVFTARFGGLVAVVHSRLSQSERYALWVKAKGGHIRVMIGPRSAVFTPFADLGIIIVDEEHEHTYTSELTPKYHTGEVATKRAELTGAKLVLGSATPSIETYQRAINGEFRLITISERINNRFPEIHIVDMRLQLAGGNKSIFSTELQEAIEYNLAHGEQTILFLNRRGYSTFVSCRNCGHVMGCGECSVNLTFHQRRNRLMCHYCGKTEPSPQECPACGSVFIKYFGVGTQKIEEEVKKLYPNATAARMDMDTTSTKNSHGRILSRFGSGEVQILIGTQMIAKGLDFPKVSLVGIIAADLSLNAGDFRSSETTFQLLMQVAGRSGRAELNGRVYIQTYNPDHYSIVFAKQNDYTGFFGHEISLRRKLNYPPFVRLFVILATGSNERDIIKRLFKLREIMLAYNRRGFFEFVGPSPATVSKIKGQYRWKLIVKGQDEELLKQFVLYTIEKLDEYEKNDKITLNLAIDPKVIL